MAQTGLVLGAHGFVGRGLISLMLEQGMKVTGVCRHAHAGLDDLAKTKPGFTPFYRGEASVTLASADEILDAVKPDTVIWSGAPEGKQSDTVVYASMMAHAAARKDYVKRFIHVGFIGGRRMQPSWWSEHMWQKELASSSSGANKRFAEGRRIVSEQVYLAGLKRGGDYAGVSLRAPIQIRKPRDGMEGVSLGKTASADSPLTETNLCATVMALVNQPNLKTTWLDVVGGPEKPQAAVDVAVSNGVNSADGEPVQDNVKSLLAKIPDDHVDEENILAFGPEVEAFGGR